MSRFRTIEIDFDIHKLIEAERHGFEEIPNDALRRLLRLPDRESKVPRKKSIQGCRSWSGEGVMLHHGTLVRMRYNGRQYEGEIVDGKWVIEGKTFDSPSGAASGVAITKKGKQTRLDGWIYWEARLLGETFWQHINALRPRQTLVSQLNAEVLGL
jgi:hypothetical protein